MNDTTFQLLKEMVLSRFDERPSLLRELEAVFLEAEQAVRGEEVILPELPDLSEVEVVLPFNVEDLSRLRRLIDETFQSLVPGEANLYLFAFVDSYFHQMILTDDVSLDNGFKENSRQLIEHCQLKGELPTLWRLLIALKQLKNH